MVWSTTYPPYAPTSAPLRPSRSAHFASGAMSQPFSIFSTMSGELAGAGVAGAGAGCWAAADDDDAEDQE